MNNTQKLREIMKKHNLTIKKVAILIGVKKRTVDSWLSRKDCKSHRNMADRYLELLLLKLNKRG